MHNRSLRRQILFHRLEWTVVWLNSFRSKRTIAPAATANWPVLGLEKNKPDNGHCHHNKAQAPYQYVAHGRTALGPPGLDGRFDDLGTVLLNHWILTGVEDRQSGGLYFGARRLLRSQPFVVSDCIGSASSATVLRNSGLCRPPESTRGWTGFAFAGVL